MFFILACVLSGSKTSYIFPLENIGQYGHFEYNKISKQIRRAEILRQQVKYQRLLKSPFVFLDTISNRTLKSYHYLRKFKEFYLIKFVSSSSLRV